MKTSETKPKAWMPEAVEMGRLARDTEAHYQALVRDNESRRARGLPEFKPSYELAAKLASRRP